MFLLNQHFHEHKRYYFLQSMAAGLMAVFILLALAIVLKLDLLGAVGAGALASSTCIVFMTPHGVMARHRNLLGGYLIGGTMGVICYLSAKTIHAIYPVLVIDHTAILFGAIAVAVTQFLMLLLDMEHPPAAGLSIGLLLENWHMDSLVIIAICLYLLALVHQLLGKRIINLV